MTPTFYEVPQKMTQNLEDLTQTFGGKVKTKLNDGDWGERQQDFTKC